MPKEILTVKKALVYLASVNENDGGDFPITLIDTNGENIYIKDIFIDDVKLDNGKVTIGIRKSDSNEDEWIESLEKDDTEEEYISHSTSVELYAGNIMGSSSFPYMQQLYSTGINCKGFIDIVCRDNCGQHLHHVINNDMLYIRKEYGARQTVYISYKTKKEK